MISYWQRIVRIDNLRLPVYMRLMAVFRFSARGSIIALLALQSVLGNAQSSGAVSSCSTDHPVRFATFNVFLNRPETGQLGIDLAAGDPQARAVAQIIQVVRPDVLLLNEFDYDGSGAALKAFVERYLAQPQGDAEAIAYPYFYLAPSNTGIPAAIDVNGDGRIEGPADAYGYGRFPGQYAMALLSRFPIQQDRVRTFQQFLWRDMPQAALPDDLSTPEPADFYSAEELRLFRLSSKSHWDIPIKLPDATVHVLAAHPTPAVFDGPEDHNGRRNHDEIRFWADYINNADYVYDDDGKGGGLSRRSRFVILGDYNADPVDGDSYEGAIHQLLGHPRVDASMPPISRGGVAAAGLDVDAPPHKGDAALDTSDFSQNLRLDYALPSKWGLRIERSGVFWPLPQDPLYALVGDGDPVVSSDHRLVWVDLHVTDCGSH